jgi:hypothetical protein
MIEGSGYVLLDLRFEEAQKRTDPDTETLLLS